MAHANSKLHVNFFKVILLMPWLTYAMAQYVNIRSGKTLIPSLVFNRGLTAVCIHDSSMLNNMHEFELAAANSDVHDDII